VTDHKPFFSIVVPVYNAETFLRPSLDSIAAQGFTDYECILVDDGSADGSAAICMEYTDRPNSPFRLIRQANGGAARATQTGVNAAHGVFVWLVDDDDLIEPTALAELHRSIGEANGGKGCDMLFFDYFETTPRERSIRRTLDIPPGSTADTLAAAMIKGRLCSFNWIVTFRRSLCAGVTFTPDVCGEDTLFVVELILNRPDVAYLPRPLYHYSFNPTSITHTASRKKHLDRIKFIHCLEALLIRYHREDLKSGPYDYFTVEAKFEMLSDGLFTKNEYRTLLSLPTPIDKKELSRYGVKKCVLLIFAETGPYSLARFLARLIRILRNILK
jgi:glycosyltransferase involved in cell wall biosynthesis